MGSTNPKTPGPLLSLVFGGTTLRKLPTTTSYCGKENGSTIYSARSPVSRPTPLPSRDVGKHRRLGFHSPPHPPDAGRPPPHCPKPAAAPPDALPSPAAPYREGSPARRSRGAAPTAGRPPVLAVSVAAVPALGAPGRPSPLRTRP